MTVNSFANIDYTAPVVGKNYTLLNAGGTALTGAATITVSGISGKDSIFIVVDGASSASADSTISFRINADTANNYFRFGQKVPYAPTMNPASVVQVRGSSDKFEMVQISTATNLGSGGIQIEGANSSGVKRLNSLGGTTGGTSTNAFYNLQGYYNSSSTVSSVSLFSDIGNFDNGTIYVYASA
jgi:hypothetical protein